MKTIEEYQKLAEDLKTENELNKTLINELKNQAKELELKYSNQEKTTTELNEKYNSVLSENLKIKENLLFGNGNTKEMKKNAFDVITEGLVNGNTNN